MIEREHYVNVRAFVSMIVAVCMLTGLLWVLPGSSAALDDDAVIRGNVSDGSTPLPDSYVKVMMFTAGGVDVNYTFTDVSGDYELEVPGGFDYMVFVANDTHYIAMESISIMPGETLDLDFILEPLAPVVTEVTIKGFVVDDMGDPMADGHVLGLTYESPDGMPLYANLTTASSSDGYFEINVIPGDNGGGVITMDYEGFMMMENGTDSPLMGGESYWFNITLVPPSYSDDAMIHGTVTESGTGTPLGNALVVADIRNEYMEEEEGYSNYTFTDASGNYELNVTNGTGRVMISKGGYSIGLFEDLEIGVGANIELNAELVPTDCVVRGNVTDLKEMSPVPFANVIITDGFDKFASTTADGSGAYELNCFSGEELYLFAQAEGYSEDWTIISLAPGEEKWHDFGIWPVSAWLEGTVTDAITGDPIVGAWIQTESEYYSEWGETDSFGYYNLSLVPGFYDVWAGAFDYAESYDTVDVPDEATVVLDFELLPYDPDEDCRLYGWVNDSTLDPGGIWSAHVSIQMGDDAYYNETWTDVDGYYEMYIPAWEFFCGVTAWQHYPEFGNYDASELVEFRLDFALDPDPYKPNLTYSQEPADNVSLHNPSAILIEIQEPNLREMALMHLMPWKVEGSWEYYYAIEHLRTSLDPMNPEDDGLPYDLDGDTYTVSQSWNATASTGWLSDGSTSVYLMAYEHDVGYDILYVLRGYYSNSTQTDIPCSAIFDPDTGECMSIRLDWGEEEADLEDPTGEFSPAILGVRFDTTDWAMPADMIHGVSLDPMAADEMTFASDRVVPSGDYRTYFYANDFGYQEDHVVTNVTVDTDPPVAHAGLDMMAIPGSTVIFNGSLSTDAVGIANYTWTFDDDGEQTLYGVSPEYTFEASGEFDVTLEVMDGGGNSDTDTVLVTIADNTDPVANAGPDQVVEMDDEVTFNGSESSDDSGVIENYTWSFEYDDVDQELYGVEATFIFEMSGEYVVTLTVRDPSGNTDTDTVTVRVNAPPVADAGADETVTVGEEVTFDGSGSTDDSGEIEAYTWTFEYDGEEQELSGVSPVFTFEIVGEYTVTLTVEDESGLTDSDQMVVTVEEAEAEDEDAEEKSFLEEYWWILAIIAIVVVAGAASAAMIMSRKGGGPPEGGAAEKPGTEEGPIEDDDDLPPPPPDDF